MRFYLFVVQHRLPFCNSLTKKSPLAEPDYLFYVCTTKVTNISLITIKLKNYGKEKCKGSLLIITHSTRILESLHVDVTHVMDEGKVVKNGDASLVDEINENGFEEFEQ